MIEIRAVLFMPTNYIRYHNLFVRVFCENNDIFWAYALRRGAMRNFGIGLIYPNIGDKTIIPLLMIKETIIIL